MDTLEGYLLKSLEFSPSDFMALTLSIYLFLPTRHGYVYIHGPGKRGHKSVRPLAST